ncbi:hypothetical protein LXL04_039576 [Taraxacum kok-saghyz]
MSREYYIAIIGRKGTNFSKYLIMQTSTNFMIQRLRKSTPAGGMKPPSCTEAGGMKPPSCTEASEKETCWKSFRRKQPPPATLTMVAGGGCLVSPIQKHLQFYEIYYYALGFQNIRPFVIWSHGSKVIAILPKRDIRAGCSGFDRFACYYHLIRYKS